MHEAGSTRFAASARRSGCATALAPARAAARWLILAALATPGAGVVAADPAERNWHTRSRAPGVVYANGFDDPASVTARVLPDTQADHVAWDGQLKASGAGSLRFDIRPGDYANSGNWRDNFSLPRDGFRVRFGAGQPFYVQFRYRRSANLDGAVFPLSRGNGGRKVAIIGEGDVPGWDYGQEGESPSCSPLELVIQDTNQRGLFQTYHSCGKFVPYQDPFASACDSRDFRLQNALDRGPQGADGCTEDRRRYSLRSQNRSVRGKPAPDDGSVRIRTGQWQTVLAKVSPGPLGVAPAPYLGRRQAGFVDSRFEVWVADEGADYVKITDVSGVVFRRRDGERDTSEAYGKIWLLPYHTGQDPAGVWPVADTAHVWYDELIVSTRPIPAPRGPHATAPERAVDLAASPRAGER